MSSIAPPDVRDMRTPDLYTARADSAAECLLPTLPDASPVMRELLCASCPLTALCTEIRERETALGNHTPPAADTRTPRDELAARRPRGIRAAVGWEAA